MRREDRRQRGIDQVGRQQVVVREHDVDRPDRPLQRLRHLGAAALKGLDAHPAQLFALDFASPGERRRLTEVRWNDRDAVFSSDGQRIYFTSDRGGRPQDQGQGADDRRPHAGSA
mgnify:CR=1 FL=1